jgi:hypothetical protein
MMFDARGHYRGTIGRKGRGPGELTAPSWLDAEIDDSIRVLDIDRVVVFDARGHAARSVVGPTVRFVWHGAFLSRTRYAVQSSLQDSRDLTRTVPVEIRSDSGRLLSSIAIPRINGQKTFLALARSHRGPNYLWLSECTTRNLRGYRLSEISDRGVRMSNVPQEREWWVEADFDREPMAALSKVQWVRQLDAQRIAVLIATPIADWRRVPVNPRNMEGDKNRYETVIELLDVLSGRLLGSARIAGFPLSLLSGSRAAVYREAEDGTPRVEIHRFALEK